jgi:hypothetical protein
VPLARHGTKHREGAHMFGPEFDRLGFLVAHDFGTSQLQKFCWGARCFQAIKRVLIYRCAASGGPVLRNGC